MSNRTDIEKTARQLANVAKAISPPGSAFAIVMWGPDESGQQWFTYTHNVAPVTGPDGIPDCRRHLAEQLRVAAHIIETRADVPPGFQGRG